MRKEPNFFNPKIGQVEEQKEQPPRKKLKISEMALFIDGQHIDEIGNPSYTDRPNMFEYDPEGGLLINGRGETIMLNPDDLAKIPHDLGHISIRRLLGENIANYSGRQFEAKLYEFYNSVKNKLKKISFLAEFFNLEWDEEKTYRAINKIMASNPDFSPEDIFNKVIDELIDENKHKRHDNNTGQIDFEQAISEIKTIGILNVDPNIAKESIVGYFLLYCQIKNIDASSPEEIYASFDNFMFLDELIDEYEKRPDSRFSDSLLVACSKLKEEWDQETE